MAAEQSVTVYLEFVLELHDGNVPRMCCVCQKLSNSCHRNI